MDPISVPAHILPLVDFISGVGELPSVSSRLPKYQQKASAEHDESLDRKARPPPITPDTIVHLYGMGGESANASAKGSVGAAGWQWQAFSPGDLHAFQRRFGLAEEGLRRVTGKGRSWWGHVEGNLDVEYLMAVSREVPHSDGSAISVDYWLSPGFGFDLVAWVVRVQADGESPLVWSLSYGEGLSVVSVAYAQRLNTEFIKLATLGVSVVVASGDYGVYSLQGNPATFNPSFPACLPTVTAVGATQLNEAGAETRGTDWSGGGFALDGYFPRKEFASWQDSVVSEYLSRQAGNLPPSRLWNAEGRALPDVSAVGVSYKIVQQRITMEVSGTSASCPVVAALVALLNDARMRADPPKKPLGFLNPFLYHPELDCKDITEGRNNAGRKGAEGFDAAAGWDPVTGRGSPIYPQWKELALQLP